MKYLRIKFIAGTHCYMNFQEGRCEYYVTYYNAQALCNKQSVHLVSISYSNAGLLQFLNLKLGIRGMSNADNILCQRKKSSSDHTSSYISSAFIELEISSGLELKW